MTQEFDEKISISDIVLDGQCDICWYYGKNDIVKVKNVKPYDLNLCKPCFISLSAIER